VINIKTKCKNDNIYINEQIMQFNKYILFNGRSAVLELGFTWFHNEKKQKNFPYNTFLNIICISIRSVHANVDNFLLLFENDVNFKQFDMLILTEIWQYINSCYYSITGFYGF